MQKETKTIRVDPVLWNNARVYCIKAKTDMSAYIDTLMRKDLSKKKEND